MFVRQKLTNRAGTIKRHKMKIIFFSFFLLLSFSIYSQDQSGVITYKGVINQTYVDSFLTNINQKDIPMNIKQGVADMYLNAGEDEYFLNFKDEESYFYHNPTLAQLETYDVGSTVGRNPVYTNSAANFMVETSRSLGNFARNALDWKLINETKNIGNYTCYKAVATERIYDRRGQGNYYDKEVIVWYTPELPINFGPKYYNGLPGLVLQVERDAFTLTATNLELNSEDKKIEINRITNDDKVISQEEYFKRIEEMTTDRERSR